MINVNMIPNNDIPVLHCSEGDTEGRKFEVALHNNGKLIDASGIQKPLLFETRKGGTEQILPENGSVPVTAPFIGDIQYPDGLRTEQKFLYRESPTSEDGQAKITHIKGNTVVFNQLIQNGNFADVTGWQTGGGATLSVANNKASVTATSINSSLRTSYELDIIANHKYLILFYVTATVNTTETRARLYKSSSLDNYGDTIALTANVKTRYLTIIAPSTSSGRILYIYPDRSVAFTGTMTIENIMLIDLTQMGLDYITSADQFTSLYPLPYYSYTQGKLLPFKGESLKTTGENLFDINDIQIGKNWIYGSASDRAIIEFDVEPSTSYTIQIQNQASFDAVPIAIYKTGNIASQISNDGITSSEQTVTTPSNCHVLCIQFSKANISSADFYGIYVCALASTYSTISLPTLDYFSSGMKSAGSVYDELTESKAITRIGERAYQSGDESDTSVITDGTTTYYALATPTEESITTASLVTEKGETVCYGEDDMLIVECNQEITSQSGEFPAKIKLQDGDDVAYSSLIKLVVEEKPNDNSAL